MKRFLSAFLLPALLIAFAAQASAASFSSLSQLQRFIENHSPADLSATGPHSVKMEGVVSDVSWCGANNHWQFTLLVEDPHASAPISSDLPQLTVHFRLHQDEPPVKEGDRVTVSGTLNALYSSVIVPWILADTINGSADF